MASKIKPADMAAQLRGMDREEAQEALQAYTKAEIAAIGRAAGVTALSGPKDRMIGQLINYCRWHLVRQ